MTRLVHGPTPGPGRDRCRRHPGPPPPGRRDPRRGRDLQPMAAGRRLVARAGGARLLQARHPRRAALHRLPGRDPRHLAPGAHLRLTHGRHPDGRGRLLGSMPMPPAFHVRPATPDDKRPSRRLHPGRARAVRPPGRRTDPDEVWNNQTAFLDFLAAHAAEWWVAEDGGVRQGHRLCRLGGRAVRALRVLRPPREPVRGVWGGAARQGLSLEVAARWGHHRAPTSSAGRYYRPAPCPLSDRRPDRQARGAGQPLTNGIEPRRPPPMTSRAIHARALGPRVRSWQRVRGGCSITARVTCTATAARSSVPPSLGRAAPLAPSPRYPPHLPSILDHIERRAAEREIAEVALEVPMVNVAMRHCWGGQFKMDTFLTFLDLESAVRPVRPLHGPSRRRSCCRSAPAPAWHRPRSAHE